MLYEEVEFNFDSEPQAYRFLNSVKNWHQRDLKAEYGRDSASVKVTYLPAANAFDDTVSRLDDLATELGGKAL
ncbi:hypothetical protein QTP81_08415 [Alteromonas sp. ASW11-36]|uniref:Uncharacterized protein n=1 Tax=Alteromonas arenosi TaxID=3055817 RepID=A0ABT7SWQ2_9ALTE|nr:hypothetical protein [Alteromonas sp. ASW11-36]MDM7860617.1 hypothetical protein [Alteromonas sp. ASW11-36]